LEARAYKDYQLESQNWLRVGRRRLLRHTLRAISGGRRDLTLLEVGAGVGQNVATLAEFGQVDVLESDDIGLEALRAIHGIRRIVDHPIPCGLEETYDVVVAMDVIEHIEDDREAMQWIADRLHPGGAVFCTVPAYQWLFSEHDVALHHFRRYNARQFRDILPPTLKVLRVGYFNTILFPLAASVRVASILLSKLTDSPKAPSQKQSGMVPLPIDTLFRSILDLESRVIYMGVDFPFGLSVYCLARSIDSAPKAF
jgi:SAM-dependent methyltransferase